MSNEDYRPALDDPNAWVPYRYHPSNIAAIILVVAFTLTTFLHIFQLCRRKTWYFIPLVIGGLFEATGYIGRILSHNDLWALGPFICNRFSSSSRPPSSLLRYTSYLAASSSSSTASATLSSDKSGSRKWRRQVPSTLFTIQAYLTFSPCGGIQAGGTLTALHTGEKLIIAGLFTQLFFFAFFIVIAGMFHYRLVNDKPVQKQIGHQRLPSTQSTSYVNLAELPWKRHLYNLYATSGLIMIRSVFRVIEYLQGNAGYLLSHEIFLYIFDAVLMLAVMLLFNWVHPSEVTEAYHKRRTTGESAELQHVRDGYMGRGTSVGKGERGAQDAYV